MHLLSTSYILTIFMGFSKNDIKIKNRKKKKVRKTLYLNDEITFFNLQFQSNNLVYSYQKSQVNSSMARWLLGISFKIY